jgi:dihydroflavonol-4-reductase
MTKILITGATGFVGRAVADAAARRGLDLRLLIRTDKYLEQVAHLKCELATGDLNDLRSLKMACRGVDVVFHLAAMYKMWVPLPDRDLMLKTNIDGTRAMIQAALDAGVSKFIYTSSVAAIGHRSDGQPSDETVEWNLEWTRDLYTKSKFQACQVVKEFIAKGAPIVITYPGAPIGWGDIKPTPTGRMYVDYVNGKVPAYFHGGFSVIDVDDCGEGHLLAYEKGKIGEGYILTHENKWLKELFDMVSDIMGTNPLSIGLPKWGGEVFGIFAEWLANNVTHEEPVLTASGARMTALPPFYTGEKAARELGLKCRPTRESLERALWYFFKRGMIKRQPKTGQPPAMQR